MQADEPAITLTGGLAGQNQTKVVTTTVCDYRSLVDGPLACLQACLTPEIWMDD